MSDSYFLRPDSRGPALEMLPGRGGRVLLTTSPGVHATHVELDPSQVEEVCRVMYRYAGLVWPGLTAGKPCTTKFREGECAGTVGHAGECTVNADDIPSEQECHGGACNAPRPAEDVVSEQERAGARRHIDLLTALSDITGLLNEIRDRLPAPPSPVCGEVDLYGTYACDQPRGHSDRHRAGITTWPNSGPQCEELWPHDGVTRCHGRVGHPEKHNAGRVVWNL